MLKPAIFTPSLILQQLRCSGTIDAVQLMAGAYPTRIPYSSIYDRYSQQMPEFVRKLDPPFFCEAIALALEIPSGGDSPPAPQPRLPQQALQHTSHARSQPLPLLGIIDESKQSALQ